MWRAGAVLLLLPVLAGSQHLPRSYYRFEDPSNLMKDSAAAALDLHPQGGAVPVARTQAEGGQVGGWMELDGCGANWNRSLLANASQLPRQCVGLGHYCNPNFGCPGQPGRPRNPRRHRCVSIFRRNSVYISIKILYQKNDYLGIILFLLLRAVKIGPGLYLYHMLVVFVRKRPSHLE